MSSMGITKIPTGNYKRETYFVKKISSYSCHNLHDTIAFCSLRYDYVEKLHIKPHRGWHVVVLLGKLLEMFKSYWAIAAACLPSLQVPFYPHSNMCRKTEHWFKISCEILLMSLCKYNYIMLIVLYDAYARLFRIMWHSLCSFLL